MGFSERCCEGFALAATIARDAGATRAQGGLCMQAHAALMPLCSALARADKAERRQAIRRITATMLPRAAASSAWPVQPRRAGWAPEPALLLLVRKQAAHRSEE